MKHFSWAVLGIREVSVPADEAEQHCVISYEYRPLATAHERRSRVGDLTSGLPVHEYVMQMENLLTFT